MRRVVPRRPHRVSFRLDDDHYDRLLRLKQHWQCQGLTDVFERCIAYAHWDTLGREEAEAAKLVDVINAKTKKKKGARNGKS